MIPSAVTVVEVGPRDGFQMEPVFIPTALKIETVSGLAAAGMRKIEATSFVNPKVIPQMADATAVMSSLAHTPAVCFMALVPNLKGARRALEAGANAVRVVLCASETYNRRNVGLSVAESLAACRDIAALARERNAGYEAIIALAFGCPLEGNVEPGRVMELAAALYESGCCEISIADSIGVANPVQVKRMMRRLQSDFPAARFSLHFHNTRGLGLANVLAAMEEGIDTFDSSIGGLGGCPVVPGGAGNIATEDLVNMLEEMGVSTGVDLGKVIAIAEKVQAFLQRRLPSCILHAGTRQSLFAAATAERDPS